MAREPRFTVGFEMHVEGLSAFRREMMDAMQELKDRLDRMEARLAETIHSEAQQIKDKLVAGDTQGAMAAIDAMEERLVAQVQGLVEDETPPTP
jgi:hypothetical protein